jgi:hypothetical protein
MARDFEMHPTTSVAPEYAGAFNIVAPFSPSSQGQDDRCEVTS